MNPLLLKLFPFLNWKARLTRENVKADILAGITGAIVVLPQGVAFAVIAGMPPQYGLYTAMIPAIIAALFGSSWHLVSGPTTAASIVLFASLSALAEPGSTQYVAYALTLTFLVGLTQLVMGLAKLGTLVNFISHSVVVGFTAGAAVLIAFKQLKNFFGIDLPRGLQFHETLIEFFKRIHETNPYVTTVATITLVAGIVVKKYFKKFPYMIASMLIGSLASILLNQLLGQEHTGISTVGALPSSFPPLSSPDLSLETLKLLAPAVLATTLLALTEAVSIARALAIRSGQHINGNQEFIGQGLSNLIGSFVSSYVATGSFNRSGVNYEAGAKTPLASLLAGLLLMFIVVLVAPLAAYLPTAAMAGILFLVAWGLIDFHHFHKIIQTSRAEGAVLLITFFGTLFLELEYAILMGVMASLVAYLNRTSKPKIVVGVPNPIDADRKFTTITPQHKVCPQLSIVRIDGSLFFGAIDHVAEFFQNLKNSPQAPKNILLKCTGINFLDVAGAEFLAQEAAKLKAQGGGLYFYGVKPLVAETLKRGHFDQEIGLDHFFMSKDQALAKIYKKLDPEICRACKTRIFRECGS